MDIIGVILLIFTTIGTLNAARIVCYYSSWAVYFKNNGSVKPEDLDPRMCTHINYAFVSVNINGSLIPRDRNSDIYKGGYRRVTALKEKNPALKVLLTIGGTKVAPILSEIAASQEKRAVMVASARSFMKNHNFDGVDFDWEFPKSADKANFVTLLTDFKRDFNKTGWLVTVAVAPGPNAGYDAAKISQIVDFINVMTYNMYGSWSKYTGQNSPLWPSSVENRWEKASLNMDAAMTKWVEAGASPEKLNAGIAFYGRSFTLANSSDDGLHAPFTGPGRAGPIIRSLQGSWIYVEFCETRDSWNCTWDDEQKMPICVNGDQWLGIDDEKSVLNKVSYINSKKFGGVMVWSVDQDDVHGRCGNRQPLLRIITDNIV